MDVSVETKKEPSTFSHQELAGGMDSSWGVIEKGLDVFKKKKNGVKTTQ